MFRGSEFPDFHLHSSSEGVSFESCPFRPQYLASRCSPSTARRGRRRHQAAVVRPAAAAVRNSQEAAVRRPPAVHKRRGCKIPVRMAPGRMLLPAVRRRPEAPPVRRYMPAEAQLDHRTPLRARKVPEVGRS